MSSDVYICFEKSVFYMHLKARLDVGFKLEDFVIGTSETFWKKNTLVETKHAADNSKTYMPLSSVSFSLSLSEFPQLKRLQHPLLFCGLGVDGEIAEGCECSCVRFRSCRCPQRR
jgi:hypothetical protein